MFEFEKLLVYQKAKAFNQSLIHLLDHNSKAKPYQKNQLSRAAFSIILNIAEGTGRFTKASKRNFYVIARGSVFECVAIIDYFNDRGIIGDHEFYEYYKSLDELSRILFKTIRNLS